MKRVWRRRRLAQKSAIEWTESTWNPITGCTLVSPGCTNCYAMRLAGGRLRHHPSRKGLTRVTKDGRVLWNGQVRFNEQWIQQPLSWRRPRRVFVCAHGDLFHEDIPDEWIDRVFAVMGIALWHTFQVLTKRAERMRSYLDSRSKSVEYWEKPARELGHTFNKWKMVGTTICLLPFPPPNIWLGVSVEDQKRANERIPLLLDTPAAVRFVSAEPLLGPISDLRTRNLDWVIVGGESGPGARPTDPEWVRSLRDQCQSDGVPFFFKQWGGRRPKAGGNVLDGRQWLEYPE